MQTNVRREYADEQMFEYDGWCNRVFGWIGGDEVVAIRRDRLNGQVYGQRMRLIEDMNRSRRYRGKSATKALKTTLWAGLLSLVLLAGYSLGISASKPPARNVLTNPSSSSFVRYTVKAGDSPWSIAASLAHEPVQVSSIAKQISAIEGGTILQPGTVLYIER